MMLRVCRCCGEPMSESANGLSRNPNICASCSSLADGMEESNLPPPGAAPAEVLVEQSPEEGYAPGQERKEPVPALTH